MSRPLRRRMRRRGGRTCAPAIPDIFKAMYWPLVGGFVAFVVIALLLGWILDPDRRRDVGERR